LQKNSFENIALDLFLLQKLNHLLVYFFPHPSCSFSAP